jgi:hypothetical protein
MNKSISTTFSIFIAIVLVFGVFSIHGNIYGQTASPNTATTNNATIGSTGGGAK